MKKIFLLIIFFGIGKLYSQTFSESVFQLLGSKRAHIKVNGAISIDSMIQLPGDTLQSAFERSLSVKDGILYIKGSGFWKSVLFDSSHISARIDAAASKGLQDVLTNNSVINQNVHITSGSPIRSWSIQASRFLLEMYAGGSQRGWFDVKVDTARFGLGDNSGVTYGIHVAQERTNLRGPLYVQNATNQDTASSILTIDANNRVHKQLKNTLQSAITVANQQVVVGTGTGTLSGSSSLIYNGSYLATGGSGSASGNFGLYSSGAIQFVVNTDGGLNAKLGNYFGWVQSSPGGSGSTRMYQDTVGVMALRNGTNRQTYRVYNTYTDDANNERISFSWKDKSNYFQIRSEAFGSGTARPIEMFAPAITLDGELTLVDSIPYTAGDYDAIVRNRSTGRVEITTISGGATDTTNISARIDAKQNAVTNLSANRVLVGSGSTDVAGSSNLTFDGSTGTLLANNGSTSGVLQLGSGTVLSRSGNNLAFQIGSTAYMNLSSAGTLRMRSDMGLAWVPSTTLTATADLSIWRDAANILAQRNGTSAQEYRNYNTVSGANSEFVSWGWQNASNVFQIASEKTGTGVARNIDVIAPAFLYNGDTVATKEDLITSIDTLLGVEITSIAAGDLLQYNAGVFKNRKLSDGLLDANGNVAIMFTPTASSVNYLNVTNSTTGNNVLLSAAGSDTDIYLQLRGKGTGTPVAYGGFTVDRADYSWNSLYVNNWAGQAAMEVDGSGHTYLSASGSQQLNLRTDNTTRLRLMENGDIYLYNGLRVATMTKSARNALVSPPDGFLVAVTGETGGTYLSVRNGADNNWQKVTTTTD